MKLIPTLCCSALINPFYPMVEVSTAQYPYSLRLLRLLACLMAGGILGQALGCLTPHLLMEDSQAAGMIAHLLMQHLSYYFLGCAFIILSLSNILIKRGVLQLKTIRPPSLLLLVSVGMASFLLIPRMDYLREIALQDGMPVMLSPFANYFAILNGITFLLLCTQIFSSALVAWRLSDAQSS
ncbi:hypothetical protein A9236_10090 [Polynucleobacter sp. QLW-P1DATA-2]|uniref:DUF4149 domain-containing protein n=1 Tax=unclassified Polynucleobacter TaxID=2640945 RepID=UPI0008F7F4B2|nr:MULTISPECIES: DUF4149 domain-containing protein [unclassified Polynucleobacter]OIM97226.1 hypothetical protein A9236_10090 [Polynucleobacter sp. QLW-P1DATA-2]OIN00029.1 hypothetical protein A9235_04455 [Polynucleobacter sp. MWH-Tro8-2-5-gr]